MTETADQQRRFKRMTTAIYDGQCVICNQTRRVIGALDWLNRVEFLDLHDHDEVSQRYPWLDQAQLMGEIHVVAPDGHTYPGFYGTRRMLRDVPLGFPVWAVLYLPGMTWVGKRVYRWIARNRYAINRLVGVELDECEDGVCKIPPKS